jgi:hypothetical protein
MVVRTRQTAGGASPIANSDGRVVFEIDDLTRANVTLHVGDVIVQRTRAGATVRTTTFDYVAMIHGTNATRAQPFRVDPVNGEVFDGPREFKLVGGRAAAAAIMGDAMLTQYEAAVT